MTQPAQPLPSISGAILGANLGSSLGANPTAGGFQVTAEALMNAANKLLEQAEILSKALRADALKKITPCGTDPVSVLAVKGFQAKIEPLVQHTTAYVQNLKNAVDTLHDQAKSYGATDDQISQSWVSYMRQSQAPAGPAAAPPPAAAGTPAPSAQARPLAWGPNGRSPR
jgi:hypothetical protein